MFRNNLNTNAILRDFPDDFNKFVYIQRWMQKIADDGYERYTYYWIAFNIYYNLIYFKKFPDKTIYNRNELERILNISKILESPKKVEIVEEFLSPNRQYRDTIANFSIEGKNKEQLPETIKSLVENRAYDPAFKKLLNALYVIRCNLFHGIKAPDDYSQNRLLTESSDVLKKILSLLLEPYCLNK